jgi:hypothetical protein
LIRRASEQVQDDHQSLMRSTAGLKLKPLYG